MVFFNRRCDEVYYGYKYASGRYGEVGVIEGAIYYVSIVKEGLYGERS